MVCRVSTAHPHALKSPRQLLEDSRHKDAARYIENQWRGVAARRTPERALGNFYSEMRWRYNLGTTHARMQEWTHAAASWTRVLRLDPNHADAKHNL